MKITVSSHSSVCVSRFSRVQLWATLWTVAFQAPLSMGFSRQEHWSGLPRPPPGDLPDPGTEPASFTSPALAGGLFTPAPRASLACVHTQERRPNNFFGAKDIGRGLAHRKWFTFVLGFCTALWVSPAPGRGRFGGWLQVENSACENCLSVSLSYTAGEGQAC